MKTLEVFKKTIYEIFWKKEYTAIGLWWFYMFPAVFATWDSADKYFGELLFIWIFVAGVKKSIGEVFNKTSK